MGAYSRTSLEGGTGNSATAKVFLPYSQAIVSPFCFPRLLLQPLPSVLITHATYDSTHALAVLAPHSQESPSVETEHLLPLVSFGPTVSAPISCCLGGGKGGTRKQCLVHYLDEPGPNPCPPETKLCHFSRTLCSFIYFYSFVLFFCLKFTSPTSNLFSKCTIQWHLVYLLLCNHHHYLIPEHFHHP